MNIFFRTINTRPGISYAAAKLLTERLVRPDEGLSLLSTLFLNKYSF